MFIHTFTQPKNTSNCFQALCLEVLSSGSSGQAHSHKGLAVQCRRLPSKQVITVQCDRDTQALCSQWVRKPISALGYQGRIPEGDISVHRQRLERTHEYFNMVTSYKSWFVCVWSREGTEECSRWGQRGRWLNPKEHGAFRILWPLGKDFNSCEAATKFQVLLLLFFSL